MRIRVKSYGGIIGFYLRKIFPNLCSNLYLSMQRKLSDSPNKRYMKMDDSDKIVPLFVNIETINKCNGFCSFCCCNVREDKRIRKVMDEDVFKKIIDDLSEINYNGVITLNINNEPFLDEKLIDKFRYVRKKIPNAYSYIYTNGSLLTLTKIDTIIKEHLLDELVVNNYSVKYKLNKPNKRLYNHLKTKNLDFKITINLRYCHEVLSNRANTSPNKDGKKIIKSYCSIPFTDLNIFPNGNVGICCCDTKEITNFGNVIDDNIIDIFNNNKFQNLRMKMINGRDSNEFCKYCDFNDIGTRRKRIKKQIKNNRRGL